MTALAAWLTRMREGLARFVENNIVADQPDIGTDDDLMAVADSLDENPCDDPWPHFRDTGCSWCRASIVLARAFTVPEAIVAADFAHWSRELGASA